MNNDGAKSLRTIQAEVDRLILGIEPGYFHPLSNFARLVEEVGELSRYLNHRFGDKIPKASEVTSQDAAQAALAEEFGDIIFSLAALANQSGVDLNEAYDLVMEKINQRDVGTRYKKIDKK